LLRNLQAATRPAAAIPSSGKQENTPGIWRPFSQYEMAREHQNRNLNLLQMMSNTELTVKTVRATLL